MYIYPSPSNIGVLLIQLKRVRLPIKWHSLVQFCCVNTWSILLNCIFSTADARASVLALVMLISMLSTLALSSSFRPNGYLLRSGTVAPEAPREQFKLNLSSAENNVSPLKPLLRLPSFNTKQSHCG